MISTPPRPAATAAAVSLVIAGVCLFAVMDAMGKYLSANLPVVQVIWARYVFAIPVIMLIAPPRTWPSLLQCERPVVQAVRGLMPLIAGMTIVTGLAFMPLADATAITFAAPLLVVALSVPMLGERVSVHGWAGVALGFAGVLLIVRPGMGAFTWAALLPLGTALSFALFQVMTRMVSRGDRPAVTLTWTVLIGLLLTTPFLPFVWQSASGGTWLLLIASGLIFGIAQYVLIRAFALAPATFLTPFTYVQIIAAILIGMAIFGDTPDLLTGVGTAIVILAGVYVLRRQSVGQPSIDAAGEGPIILGEPPKP